MRTSLSTLSRLIKADHNRRSRLHTLSGQLVISPDIARAVLSTTKRHILGQYPTLPWITYPAIKFLRKRLADRTLFEFGSGTSTKWFAAHCRKVWSIENNRDWFQRIEKDVNRLPNVNIVFAPTDADLVSAIAETANSETSFDAIVIDAQPNEAGGPYASSDDLRVACLRSSLQFAGKGCLLIIDNTDAMPLLSAEIRRLFPADKIIRFSGWVPGILHPNETTIVML